MCAFLISRGKNKSSLWVSLSDLSLKWSNQNLHLSAWRQTVVIQTYAKIRKHIIHVARLWKNDFLVPSGFDRQILTMLLRLFFILCSRGDAAYETENPEDLWDILLRLEH